MADLRSTGSLRALIEVAARAGFKNQSHFTTLFRHATTLTPRAYRESLGR